VASTREHWKRWRACPARARHGEGAKLEDIFEQIVGRDRHAQRRDQDRHGRFARGAHREPAQARARRREGLLHPSWCRQHHRGDIQLAAASNATIIGFNVRPDRGARELAEAEGVEIRTYEIIYQVIDDVQNAMLGLLAPEYEEVVTGDAEVREVFRIPRIGAVAGCLVQNGVITRGSKVRFLREGTIIWKGEISSLRRFKEDVREVASGFECGIGLSDFQDLKSGDIIETFDLREIPRG
jgi:translation initiation factor IF-2